MARIATLDEAYPYAGLDSGASEVDRQFLQGIVDACEEHSERVLTRTFAPLPLPDGNGDDTGTPVVKKYRTKQRNFITVPDLRVIVSITLDGIALVEGTDYELDSYDEPVTTIELNPARTVLAGARQELIVTGRWGFWPKGPETARLGILALAGRTYRRRDAWWQDMLTTEDGTTTLFAEDAPKETKMMVQAFRHHRLAFA